MLGCNILKTCYREAKFGNGETIGARDLLGNMRIKYIWKQLGPLCVAGYSEFKRHAAAGDRVTQFGGAFISGRNRYGRAICCVSTWKGPRALF
ncbi:dehydrogenase e1 and transketolase domain-containing protein 1 [Paraburkholderia caribensis MBA4]|uniref:Dehydrogenase e1 and transketolase domain-containing protein 1 n=1 Tax=Paraburkholderia caribensis MBA4 TaxID=1323664 RepID=A0A0P0RFB7_9BURK|nr:dehydrogenase e1 and transketolase domain-containing protein 1 [Paraburkholderia caribensis MBA4]